jgi:hypothetical protein
MGKMTGDKGGGTRTREVRASYSRGIRVNRRRAGAYMGTTRKRDLRVQFGHPLGSEARLTFGPRSSNPKTRKVAKRRAHHYTKFGMIFARNLSEQVPSYRSTHTLSGRKKSLSR